MGKIEKWHLLPSVNRNFNKTVIEMFLEKFCINYIYDYLLVCGGCHGNHNANKKWKAL